MPTATRSLAETARLFHALSDETRLEIIVLLRSGERCVCELTDALDAAQSRLSFHLKVLKDAEVVTDRREGRWVYYALSPDLPSEIQEALEDLKRDSPSARRSARCC